MSEPHILKIAQSGRPATATKGGSLLGFSVQPFHLCQTPAFRKQLNVLTQ
jgi:hypothetical protein